MYSSGDALNSTSIGEFINKFIFNFVKTLEYNKIKKIIGLHDFGECCSNMTNEYREMFNNKFDEYCKENKIPIFKNDLLNTFDFMKTYNNVTVFTFSINKHLYNKPFSEVNLFIKSFLVVYNNNTNKYDLYINEDLTNNELIINLTKICDIFNKNIKPPCRIHFIQNPYSRIYLRHFNNNFENCDMDLMKLFYTEECHLTKGIYFDVDTPKNVYKYSFNYNLSTAIPMFIKDEEFFKNLLKMDVIKNV